MDSILASHLNFGSRAVLHVVSSMDAIRYDSGKKPQLYAVSLHCSIVQFCGGCHAMARTQHTAGIPVLLRSIFEALVDLENLLHDADYYERMDAADRKQAIKLWEASEGNPLLVGIGKKYDVRTIASHAQQELDALYARGRGPQDMKQRCDSVGRANEYASVYFMLCMDTHNNVTALMERHAGEGAAGKVLVDAFGDGDPFVLARRVFQATGWMLQSAAALHTALQTGQTFVPLLEEIESMRAGIVN